MDSQGELTALLGRNHAKCNTSTSAISFTRKHKFPYRQFCILGFCLFTEAVASGSALTCSFQMTRDLKAGTYSPIYGNLLISTYALAEACSAIYWIPLSQRLGKKPVFLLGLAGLALSNLLFGIANNYWLALSARALGGLLNGNVALAPIMVAELTRRPEHDTAVFAMPSFVWAFGQMVGCLAGGFTAHFTQRYPKDIFASRLFTRYPYLLPNLISSYLLVIGIVQGFCLLKEPHNNTLLESEKNRGGIEQPTKSKRELPRHQTSNIEHSYNEKSPLLPHNSENCPALLINNSEIMKNLSPRILGSFAVATEAHKLPREASKATLERTYSKRIVLWGVALFLLTFHEAGFLSLMPIYILDDSRQTHHHLDLKGGRGQNLSQVGIYLAFSSFAALIIQGTVLPLFTAVAGVWSAVMMATFACPVIISAMPFMSLLSNPRVGIFVALALQRLVTVSARSAQVSLLKQAMRSTTSLTKVHQMAVSVCSVARVLSPLMVGVMYSSLGSAAAWWSCALVATAAVTELGFICTIENGRYMRFKRSSMTTGLNEKV